MKKILLALMLMVFGVNMVKGQEIDLGKFSKNNALDFLFGSIDYEITFLPPNHLDASEDAYGFVSIDAGLSEKDYRIENIRMEEKERIKTIYIETKEPVSGHYYNEKSDTFVFTFRNDIVIEKGFSDGKSYITEKYEPKDNGLYSKQFQKMWDYIKKNHLDKSSSASTGTQPSASNQTQSYRFCPDSHHPHSIDLGLPSGTKWACCNVGASSPEDYGNYYAWGETTTKSTYDWSNYKWCRGAYDKLTKYCTKSSFGTVDNKTVLDLSDDAALANWGGSWRMPTYAQFKELFDKCTHVWTTVNGVNGTKFTGPNGASIFLPAAGWRYSADSSSRGSLGDYWFSTLNESNPNYAYFLSFGSGDAEVGSSDRDSGQSVRPVRSN